jgi:hypothetical protein
MRIFCKLGRNLRLDQRVILLPVPPLLLYCPLRVTSFPVSAPFAHKAHFFNIINYSFIGNRVYLKIGPCQGKITVKYKHAAIVVGFSPEAQ